MVITDARLGGMSGYELLRKSQSMADLPALMITAYATPKLAVEAIKAGRWIIWPSHSRRRNCSSPRRGARSGTSPTENAALRARAGEAFGLEQIVGESPRCRNCGS